jgi:hypothetical protein
MSSPTGRRGHATRRGRGNNRNANNPANTARNDQERVLTPPPSARVTTAVPPVQGYTARRPLHDHVSVTQTPTVMSTETHGEIMRCCRGLLESCGQLQQALPELMSSLEHLRTRVSDRLTSNRPDHGLYDGSLSLRQVLIQTQHFLNQLIQLDQCVQQEHGSLTSSRPRSATTTIPDAPLLGALSSPEQLLDESSVASIGTYDQNISEASVERIEIDRVLQSAIDTSFALANWYGDHNEEELAGDIRTMAEACERRWHSADGLNLTGELETVRENPEQAHTFEDASVDELPSMGTFTQVDLDVVRAAKRRRTG